MEIKVPCPCGQTYAFDVEPVNGLMPCPVSCPACGADGTVGANDVIRESQSASPPFVAAPSVVSAAASVATTPEAPATTGKLRINRAAPVPEPAAPTISPVDAPPEPPKPTYTRTYQPAAPPAEDAANIPMGILGGVIAGGIAMTGWYYLTMDTDKEFGVVAWLVGVVTGLGVRILGRDGSPVMGYIAAVCAALAILGGDFLVVNSTFNKVEDMMGNFGEIAYQADLATAKEAAKLQTDQEIKTYLEKEADGEPVTSQDIENFRQKELPRLKDLDSGKTSKEDYLKEHSPKTASVFSFGMRFKMFKESLSLFTMLWLIFGIGSAWRIGTR